MISELSNFFPIHKRLWKKVNMKAEITPSKMVQWYKVKLGDF